MAAFQTGLAQPTGSVVVFVDADDMLFLQFHNAHQPEVERARVLGRLQVRRPDGQPRRQRGRGELLRHGQRWQEIVANRKRLMAAKPNVGTFNFQVYTTVSAMNVWHMVDFHKEWIDQGLVEPDQILLNLLTTPDYYSAQILPCDEKQRVMDHCHQFMATHLSKHPAQRKKYEAVLTFMSQEDGSHHLPAFVDWMRKLDARRFERFVDVFPEWRPLFDRYGA